MPEPKLGSTHDAGISSRKEAARGRGVSPPPHLRVCSRGRQTISFSLSLRGQVPVTGRGDTVASPLSRGCLPPGRQWGRAEMSLGTREAHPRPHLLLQLGRRARAPGQRLCFPDSNYVCGSAASAGDAAPLPCTPRMTGGARAAGGGSGAGRRPPRSRCTAEAREPGWRWPTHLAALSCAGRGEPCPRGAGRRLGAPGRRRRRAGQSSACRSGGSLLSRGLQRRAGWRARRLGASRVGRATAVAWRSRRATFCPLLLPLGSWARPRRRRCLRSRPAGPVSGLSWRTGRQVQRSASCGGGCVGRLLPGLPPSGAAPRDPGSSPAKVARPRRGKEESGRCPIPLLPHPTTPNSSC